MDADLDTLATALYVRTDDLLKASPGRSPARPAVGIAPRITDAELVTLAVMQALLGRTSEARWLRYARAQLRHLFPYLPQQPGYREGEPEHGEPVAHLVLRLAVLHAVRRGLATSTESSPVTKPIRPPLATSHTDTHRSAGHSG